MHNKSVVPKNTAYEYNVGRVKNDKTALRNFSHYFIIFNKICSVFAITSNTVVQTKCYSYREKKNLGELHNIKY